MFKDVLPDQGTIILKSEVVQNKMLDPQDQVWRKGMPLAL